MTNDYEGWSGLVKAAEDGEPGATHALFLELIWFLDDKKIDMNGVCRSKEVRKFLAKRLSEVLSANKNDAGKV